MLDALRADVDVIAQAEAYRNTPLADRTPAMELKLYAAIERQAALQAEAQGALAEWGRAGQIVRQISRDPADLVAQTRGRHHQYPDGFVLYCGTMFSPVQDRDGPGQGFTHHLGDVVTISAPELGALTNTVRLSTEAPEWQFGSGALMRNLAQRGLI